MITPAELQALWDARQGQEREEALLFVLERELRARWVPGTTTYIPIGGRQTPEEVEAQIAACREAGWTVRALRTMYGTTLVFKTAQGEADGDTGEDES